VRFEGRAFSAAACKDGAGGGRAAVEAAAAMSKAVTGAAGAGPVSSGPRRRYSPVTNLNVLEDRPRVGFTFGIVRKDVGTPMSYGIARCHATPNP